MLATDDGNAVLGDNGPLRLPAAGAVSIDQDGRSAPERRPSAAPKIVDFADYGGLRARARPASARGGRDGGPATDARPVAGALEQSNVSIVERIAELTEVSRSFEALPSAVSHADERRGRPGDHGTGRR